MFGRAEREERRKREESLAITACLVYSQSISACEEEPDRDIPIACFPYHPTRGWGEALRGNTSDPST